MSQCREAHIQQTAFKCRLFDVLVEPVLSYGCHVWGPDLCMARFDNPMSTVRNPLEAAHIFFLRHMAGVGSRVHLASLYREFARYPMWVHWAALAARFWRRMARQEDGMLSRAFQSDIQIMLDGCRACWTYHFLQLMTKLGVIAADRWSPRRPRGVGGWQRPTIDAIMALTFEEAVVKRAAEQRLDCVWRDLPNDPRLATEQVLACTYHRWVSPPEGGPLHLKQRIPFPLKQTLMRFRLGWHDLAIQHGRMYGGVARAQRCCSLCRRQGHGCHVEDIQHFLLECPAYANVRRRYPGVFGGPTGMPVSDLSRLPPHALCAYVFNRPDQLGLAQALAEMYDLRRNLLCATPVRTPPASGPSMGGRAPLMCMVVSTVLLLSLVLAIGVHTLLAW